MAQFKDFDISNAKHYITNRCDGPLTDFVIISRGCQLVKLDVKPVIAANAIIECLQELGFMLENNEVIETGN